jgi:hypothetical protein
MSHIQAQNFALNSSNEQFTALWKLTRLMKHAGWRYKASANGTTTVDTSANPNSDFWGGGGTVQGPTTVAFTIAAPNSTAFGGRSTLTGLAAMTANSVGHFLKITGATNGANNGTWLITKFISATSVQIENPAAVAETTPGTATYTELSALTDTYPPAGVAGSGSWLILQGPSTVRIPIGTIANTTGQFIKGENVTQATSGAQGEVLGVYIDTVGGGFLVVAPRVSGTGGDPRGWDHTHTLTGALSGAMVTPTATVIEYVREVVFWYNDIHSGHIFYQCVDSASESTATVASTTIAAASNGQTLPQGTIFVGSTSGFPSAGTIVVQTATRFETVTYAGTTATSFVGCQGGTSPMATGNVVKWSIGRFSTMATGSSFSQPPGGAVSNDTTANGFPTTGSMAVLGSAATGTAATNSAAWNNYSSSVSAGKAQLFAANCIEDANISADGSATMAIGVATNLAGNTTTTGVQALPTGTINVAAGSTAGFGSTGIALITTSSGVQIVKFTGTGATTLTGCTGGAGNTSNGGLVTAGYFTLMGFLRLDDTEEGEVDPYAWGITNSPSSTYQRSRLQTAVSQTSLADQGSATSSGVQSGWSASSGFMAFKHRGLPNTVYFNDSYQEYQGALVGFSNAPAAGTNAASPDLVACTPATVTVREPFFLVSFGAGVGQSAGNKHRKGSTRWWQVVQVNASTDTYDGKLWVQLSSTSPNIIVGPGDGSTVPANQ